MPLRQTLLCTLLILLFAPVYGEQAKLIELTAAADPWPPYIDESLPLGGVSVQLADAAFRTQGYTVKNKIVPWARAIAETQLGRTDLILDAWWSEERSKVFHYSRPYINGPVKFIKRQGDPFEYTDLASLNHKSLALVRNYAYGDALLNAKNYQPYVVTEFMLGIKMLVKQRVDLAIENELVARTRLAKEAPELLAQISFTNNALSDNQVYLIASFQNPRHQEIIEAFNKGLNIILQDGTYQKIMQQNHLAMPEMFDLEPPQTEEDVE